MGGDRRIPNIVIEDRARRSAYYIPAERIEDFRAGAHVWSKVNGRTVTFNIPSENPIDELPPYMQTPESNPSILIRHPAGKAAYFLTYDQLQAFIVEASVDSNTANALRFAIPRSAN